jgi:hypothetical protein
MSSIINQSSGGGNKKAGFPYIIGRTAAAGSRFIVDRPHSFLIMPLNVSVNQNLPAGFDSRIRMR